MMLFHVPSNVSSFINCGSKSACDKQEVIMIIIILIIIIIMIIVEVRGGFAAWYSCPVCAYRSV